MAPLKAAADLIRYEDLVEQLWLSLFPPHPARPDYRNPAIDQVINYFYDLYELPKPGGKKGLYNRYAAHTLIKRYGLDHLLSIIKFGAAVRSHKYAPVIANLQDLRDKDDRLKLYAERLKAERTNTADIDKQLADIDGGGR